METIKTIRETRKATSKATSKPAKGLSKAKVMARVKLVGMIVLGCGIPAASLMASHFGGDMLKQGNYLGLAFLAITLTILGVSLPHLVSAIEDITGSPASHAWCLAVAVDASIVVCELAGVTGYQTMAMTGYMFSVTVVSMLLNCWAFIAHK